MYISIHGGEEESDVNVKDGENKRSCDYSWCAQYVDESQIVC